MSYPSPRTKGIRRTASPCRPWGPSVHHPDFVLQGQILSSPGEGYDRSRPKLSPVCPVPIVYGPSRSTRPGPRRNPVPTPDVMRLTTESRGKGGRDWSTRPPSLEGREGPRTSGFEGGSYVPSDPLGLAGRGPMVLTSSPTGESGYLTPYLLSVVTSTSSVFSQ